MKETQLETGIKMALILVNKIDNLKIDCTL